MKAVEVLSIVALLATITLQVAQTQPSSSLGESDTDASTEELDEAFDPSLDVAYHHLRGSAGLQDHIDAIFAARDTSDGTAPQRDEADELYDLVLELKDSSPPADHESNRDYGTTPVPDLWYTSPHAPVPFGEPVDVAEYQNDVVAMFLERDARRDDGSLRPGRADLSDFEDNRFDLSVDDSRTCKIEETELQTEQIEELQTEQALTVSRNTPKFTPSFTYTLSTLRCPSESRSTGTTGFAGGSGGYGPSIPRAPMPNIMSHMAGSTRNGVPLVVLHPTPPIRPISDDLIVHTLTPPETHACNDLTLLHRYVGVIRYLRSMSNVLPTQFSAAITPQTPHTAEYMHAFSVIEGPGGRNIVELRSRALGEISDKATLILNTIFRPPIILPNMFIVLKKHILRTETKLWMRIVDILQSATSHHGFHGTRWVNKDSGEFIIDTFTNLFVQLNRYQSQYGLPVFIQDCLVIDRLRRSCRPPVLRRVSSHNSMKNIFNARNPLVREYIAFTNRLLHCVGNYMDDEPSVARINSQPDSTVVSMTTASNEAATSHIQSLPVASVVARQALRNVHAESTSTVSVAPARAVRPNSSSRFRPSILRAPASKRTRTDQDYRHDQHGP